MFSPNMYGRNYNPAVPLFDTTDVPSLWTKGQMWMDTGALISNEEAGGNIRTFTGKKYNNLWASGAALDTQATFTLDPAYSLVTLDAFDQFGPFTTNLLDFPPRNNSFGQWTPATINSSPVPTVLAETPLPFPQTGTADRISYNNSAAFADGALVRSKEVDINAGDTVPYEVTVAAANGDGFKTLMALKDDSDQIIEQATVVFSNVLARAGTGQQLLTVDDGVENLLGSVSNTSVSGSLLDISNWQGSGWTASTSAIAAPDGTLTATDLTTAGSFSLTAKLTESTASTWELGSSYVEAATVTASIYIYKPSVTAAFNFIVFTGTPSSPVERINIKFDSSLQIIFFLSTTTGANPYTAERNLWIEDIGSTGWARITVSLHDFDSSSQELYFWPLYSSGASVTAWSPELRYGDWVSRGKNRVTSGEDLLDPDWTHTNATVTRSDEVTPAGTSSAVLVVPDSGSRYLNQDGPKQSWDIVDPSTTPCRVTLSAYYKDAGLGFAALGLSNSAGYLATAQIDLATGAAGPVGTHPNPASDLTTDFEDVGSGGKSVHSL
jgi:hypothetical protein